MSDEMIHQLVHELFSGAVRIQRLAEDLHVTLTKATPLDARSANDDRERSGPGSDLADLTTAH